MAQPSYPISSASLLIHVAIVLGHKLVSAFRNLRRNKFNYVMAGRFMGAILLIIFSAQAISTLYVSKTPTSEHYLQEAAKRTSAAKSLPETEVSAWLAWFNEGQAYDSLAHHTAKMSTVMPVWYKLSSSGKIELINDVYRRDEILKLAHKNDIAVLPTIGNDFDAERVSKLLNNQDMQNLLIEKLVSEAQGSGYAGWDIDWEQLYPGDRGGLTYFIQNLGTALHQSGLKLSIDVPVPSTKSDSSDQDKAFDYAELSQYVDEVRVMAYDYHYEESSPGAVTPLDSYEATLKTVTGAIPSSKLVIGLPTYGYDWNLKSKNGSPVQYDEAMNIIEAHHGKLTRDKHTAALVGRYKVDGVEHAVWLNDSQATRAQITIGRSYGVYKYSLWRLGGEDPDTWSDL